MQSNQEVMWEIRKDIDKCVKAKYNITQIKYGSDEYFLVTSIEKLIHEKRVCMGVTWEEVYKKCDELIKLAYEFLSYKL